MENQKPALKLNYKRTFCIGLAFFTILMLWQVYNTYCPLFLSDYFVRTLGGTTEDHSYLVGIIMAMDNVLALFMLPLFGKLSDRTNTKLGKRMPYIIAGVVVAVIVFPLIPILFIYNKYIWMIVMMAIILLAMNLYRSPAVSLMPDITPKPLRSKANAIINFVGYLGAIFAGALAILFPADKNEVTGYLGYDPNTIWIPFVLTAVLMIVALVILFFKIKENKIAKEVASEMEEGERQAEAESSLAEDKPLTKLDKRNLIILMLSIFLWFFAFNAIETFGSTFSTEHLELGTGWWGTAVIVMTICSLLGFIPGGYIADKLGRKWTIVLGLGLMLVSLLIATFVMIPWLLYILIGIAGIGWAWVNVNSYPMVVEMASKKTVGRLTGWYYAASMLAQSLTPICVGFFFKALGYEWLFPYATIFTTIALVVFLFHKKPSHHDTAPALIDGSTTAQDSKAETTTTTENLETTKDSRVGDTTNKITKDSTTAQDSGADDTNKKDNEADDKISKQGKVVGDTNKKARTIKKSSTMQSAGDSEKPAKTIRKTAKTTQTVALTTQEDDIATEFKKNSRKKATSESAENKTSTTKVTNKPAKGDTSKKHTIPPKLTSNEE